MSKFGTQLRILVLGLLTAGAVLVGVLNLREQRFFRLPEDGVLWVNSAEGAVAAAVVPASPADQVGIEPGDVLVAVNRQVVGNAEQAGQMLFALEVGAPAEYWILRQQSPLELRLIPEAQARPTVRIYLQAAGVFYLLLGLFVVWSRRFRAPCTTHFYLFCLSSFVLFVYSYTGRLDSLDWVVYWSSVGALLLQPALFVHFCRAYPVSFSGRADFRKRSILPLLSIYGPGALLGLAHVAVGLGLLRFAAVSLAELRWLLDRLEIGYLVAMFLAGITLLGFAYRRAGTGRVRKQVAWILGGAALGIGPFAWGYALPYFWGATPGAWGNLSALSLGILPLALSYAMVRHRLLAVEVALERGLAYTLATGTLVGVYLAVVALVGNFFRANFPASGTAGLVLAVIATGLLFQPLQTWIQTQFEQYFLRRRYDYRKTLLNFGRELSSETNRDRMIASLLQQLTRTLKIQRAAVLVKSPMQPHGFTLRGTAGAPDWDRPDFTGDFSFLNQLETPHGMIQDRLFFPDWDLAPQRVLGPSGAENSSWRETLARMELPYYFACRARNRLVAVLGIGKTEDGELLSEEDTALLETLSGYLAIAMENARLVESLAAKASQYEHLQQFSENILESINVGLIAMDLEDRIEAVNTPLQLMYPMPVQEARGEKLSAILPPDLMEQIARLRDDAGIHNIFRYRLRTRLGEERVFNIAIAPLLSNNCDLIGRLMVFDDVTDRVALETQLVQAEKLSSIGLLAAGVAHEVNTPLTVISTQAQMLSKQFPPGDKTSKILEKIISQTFRASEIVNSLLNFSRTHGAAFAPVELNKVISETLLLLDHQFKTSHIATESLLDPSLPPISGNCGKLQQVFLNLFLNAKDAMPGGGRLRVATWAEDSHVRVEINDTGVGIPAEYLHRIFDPFFTTKGPGRGTGLGLSVSYGIVQEHAGKIQAESGPGSGTRFCLDFPALRKTVHA